jgi:hypothetical protein
MFAYSSRSDKQSCRKLGLLILQEQEEISEESKLRKSVLSSTPSEEDFCSSEIKHDRRAICLFWWVDYRIEGQTDEKLLGLSTNKYVSCSSETKNGGKTAPGSNLLVSARILQEQRPCLRRIILSSSPDEELYCRLKTKKGKKKQRRDQYFCFAGKITRTKASTLKMSFVFESR